jgi:hypothetical protein
VAIDKPRFKLIAAIVIPAGLFIAVAGYGVWWLNDNIGAPGPGLTGSGGCTTADAVNLQLVYADGHTVQMCTRDRPACLNETFPAPRTVDQPAGPQAPITEFRLRNQLRSTSRRYILFMQFDAGLPAETAEHTLQLDPRFAMPGPPGSSPSSNIPGQMAVVQITPRDPSDSGWTTKSGSLTVSSSHGVARGRIDGIVSDGTTRSDRPPSTSTTQAPLRITGTFTCNH